LLSIIINLYKHPVPPSICASRDAKCLSEIADIKDKQAQADKFLSCVKAYKTCIENSYPDDDKFR